MASDQEAELLKRCRSGEPAAWDHLFETYYPAAARFVFQLCPDFTREDTEEVCQEVFLSIVKNLDSFGGRSRFQTWVFRIAANKAQDHRAKQHALKRGGGQAPLSLQNEDPDTGLTLELPSGGPTPDLVLENAEQLALVYQALDKLGPPCRQIVELRYFAELSYEELAADLGLNIKTVSSRLSKCLDRLEQIARQVFAGAKTQPFPSNT